jgi:hydroxypyruvate isomerase
MIDRRAALRAALAPCALPLLPKSVPALWSPVRARQEQPPAGEVASAMRRSKTRFAANVEMWWGGKPLLERVRAAAELGFHGIELWPWRGKDIDALARTTKELGLEVAQFTAWGFSPGMNDPVNHPAVLKEIEESCQVAKRLDCKAMTVIAGNDQPGMSKDQMHANVVTALKLAAPIAEQHGVTLILEPMNGRVDHPGHCLYGSADTVAICKAVASPFVKINWDLYHMQIAEGDLCGRLREGFAHLGYVQLADHPGRYEPTTGEIHYPRVLRELHELGYRGLVGCECRPMNGENLAAARIASVGAWA